jgi:hypothetical protein
MIKILNLLILCICIGCGTETGNPLLDPDHLNSDQPVVGLLETMCLKLSKCHAGLTFNICESNVLLQDNIDTAIGLGDGIYTSYQAIIDAESNGEISENRLPTVQCYLDITNMKCNDSEVTNAYDIANPTDFTSVYKLLITGAGSCQDMFN